MRERMQNVPGERRAALCTGCLGTNEVGIVGGMGTASVYGSEDGLRRPPMHNRCAIQPTSSSFRSARPTATAKSGPIEQSIGRMNAGASVFANGSAIETSMEKNERAYSTKAGVTPPPPVSTIAVTAF